MSLLRSVLLIFGIGAISAYPLRFLTPLEAGGLAVLSSLAYLLFAFFIYPFYFSPFRHLPEPPNGSNFPWAHAERLRRETNGESFRRWTQEVRNDGIIRFRVLFNQECLLVTSPEAVKEMTVEKADHFMKPAQPAFLLRKILGNGVLIAEGDEHKRQRKALMPAFSFRHIKDLYPVFWAKARHVTDEISKASVGSPHLPAQRAYDWASRATLDIIGDAAMGYDFNSVGDPSGEIISTYRVLFDNQPPHFRWSFIGIWTPVELLFSLPLPLFRIGKTAASRIRALGFDVVRSKRAAIASGKDTSVDIVSVAIRSGQFSDEELVNQIMTFLAAGHETTASALTWATYLLCHHPDVQQRLREEVRANLPSVRDPASTITPNDIDALPYLNAVCNEVLRFIPSVPMTVRDAKVDTTVLGQRIPKGTHIYLSPWAMNHSAEFWGGESAGTFDPQRWLDDGMANVGGASSNFANMTFLHGVRSCIGKDFAKAELKCLLAAWIGRFDVRWSGDLPLPPDISGWVTVRPGHQLPVVFRDVGGW